jgi:polyphosphate kinase
VHDPALRAEVLETVELCLADNTNAWVLAADGTWARRRPDGAALNAQHEIMARHAARAAETAKT